MLRPEKQSLELFAAGVDAIVEAQRLVALNYFEDGSVEAACPPLKALLHVMAHGAYEQMQLDDPSFRELFDRADELARDQIIPLWEQVADAIDALHIQVVEEQGGTRHTGLRIFVVGNEASIGTPLCVS